MRSERAPRLSVVIASHNAHAVIGECLEALFHQAGAHEIEVLVVDCSTDGTDRLIRNCFPNVRLLHFARPMTVPQLRGAGIAAARGEIIAILDPYCIVGDRWLTSLIEIHTTRTEPAIGGAVELADAPAQPLTTWAMYFCEYAAFAPPLQDGPSTDLTGNNIAYKRHALGDVSALARSGFWKTFLNRQLRMEGHQLWTTSGLVVRLRKPIPFMEFARSRYHHGRCFAGMRIAGAGRFERWARATTTPGLPIVALWRQARSVWPKRRYQAAFLSAVPLLLLLHSSWAWGELWGYLRGRGESCAQLFY